MGQHDVMHEINCTCNKYQEQSGIGCFTPDFYWNWFSLGSCTGPPKDHFYILQYHQGVLTLSLNVTTFCLLGTTYSLLGNTYSLFGNTYSLFVTTYWLLGTTYCLLGPTYTENTLSWGKDHCTGGLQFNMTGSDQKENMFL